MCEIGAQSGRVSESCSFAHQPLLKDPSRHCFVCYRFVRLIDLFGANAVLLQFQNQHTFMGGPIVLLHTLNLQSYFLCSFTHSILSVNLHARNQLCPF
jgi:hypothetical protein